MIKTFKGSYVVEAAFVLPIVLMVIFALIYLGFSLHDEVCIINIIERDQREAAEHLRHQCMKGKDGHDIIYRKINEKPKIEEVERKLEADLSEQLSGKLFITQVGDIKVKTGLTNIKISYSQTASINASAIFRYFGERERKKEAGAVIYDPMKMVRMIGGYMESESGI